MARWNMAKLCSSIKDCAEAPEDLAKGGLPLEEVHEGMDELKRRFPHEAVNGDKSLT